VLEAFQSCTAQTRSLRAMRVCQLINAVLVDLKSFAKAGGQMDGYYVGSQSSINAKSMTIFVSANDMRIALQGPNPFRVPSLS
jgi:hypothetical protein